jgi:hypothetical protein
MFENIGDISSLIGIPLALFIIIMIWSNIWKFIAMWKAGRNNSLVWFIVFALVNTVGILEILYIFVFSKKKKKVSHSRKKRR